MPPGRVSLHAFLHTSLLCLLLPHASARTWTDTRGRQMEADFVGIAEQGNVVLRKGDKEFEYPLEFLGSNDRAWLMEQDHLEAATIPGTTALTHAIRTEDFAAAKLHIKPPAINFPDLGGYHPLTYAAYTGNLDLVNALLSSGANPNAVEHDGTTALFVAALFDHPDMIRALHRHGATYPDTSNPRQPCGASVRSGATGSLEMLFRLYPHINPDIGWPWPPNRWREGRVMNGDEYSPYCARSPLLFATYAGHDKIALTLLEHGADPRTTSSTEIQPLHYAAGNPQISDEVVSELLKRGCSPASDSWANHFAPRTPLDYAASANALDKLRLMAKRLNAAEHPVAYRRAAFIASAAGNREAMEFLFRELNEEIPNIADMVKALPPRRAGGGGTHATLQVDPVNDPLPAISSGAADAPAPEGSIAVIAPRSLDDHAAMLTLELSQIQGVTVVERNQIGHLIEENLIRHFDSGKDATAVPGLSLIPADKVLIIWEVRIDDRRFIRASLHSTSTRLTLARHVIAYSEPDENWAREELAPMLDAMRRPDEDAHGTTAVTLVPITPASPGRQCLEMAKYTNLMLPGRVVRQPDTALLTLMQMRHIETENALAREDSYWKAGWIVEGSLALQGEDGVKLLLAAASLRDAETHEIEVMGIRSELASVIDRAWNEMAEKIGFQKTASDVNPKPLPDPRREGELVASQARWFLDANSPRDAMHLANAAYILGNHSESLLRTMTEAAIESLPIQQKFFCEHCFSNPRLIEPNIRLRFANSIPRFLTLCETARLYTAELKGRLSSPKRPSGRSGSRARTYNEIVSHALFELHFYRTIMEDCLAAKSYAEDLRRLDREIGLLTLEYMEKCRGDDSEIDTLSDLILRRNENYYGRHSPELLEKIIDRLVHLCRAKPDDHSVSRLMDQLLYHGSPVNSAGLLHSLSGRLLSTRELTRHRPCRAAQLKVKLASGREAKIRALKDVLAAATDPSDTLSIAPGIDLDWLIHLDGSPPGHGLLERMHLLKPGGIRSLIADFGDGFGETAECTRMAYWYLDLIRLPAMQPESRDVRLIEQTAKLTALPEDKRLSTFEMLGVRELLIKRELLSPAVAHAIAPLLPEDKNGLYPAKPAESHITLEPMITLPGDGNWSQHARPTQATLHGDELWLPATYFESGGNVRNVRNPPAGRHVIHVIRLDDLTVRTIELPAEPEVDTRWMASTQVSATEPSIRRPVIIGANHAYFLKCPSPGRLYSIDLKTLGPAEVKLPLPHVIATSARTRGDTLYVSIAKELPSMTSKEKSGITALVAVAGDEIADTLVSSQRKPARTPLDHPTTRVDLIHVGDSELNLFSNKDSSYIEPELYKAASWGWSEKNWKSLDARQVRAIRRMADDAHWKRYRLQRSLRIDGYEMLITEDDYKGGTGPVAVLLKDPLHLRSFKADWLKIPGHAKDFIPVPVSASPVDDPQMTRKMYSFQIPPVPGKPYKLSFRTETANKLIEDGDYDIQILGKWRERYLVFLTKELVAMPAIWTMSADEFEKTAREALGR